MIHTNNIERVENKKFEDGEWWYCGASDGGRRRIKAHIKKNETRMFVNGKYISKNHPLHKAGNYKTFEQAAFSSLAKYANTNEGQVYIITNPAWKDWIKIGMAIDSNDRCNSFQTSSPFRDYVLEYRKDFKDRKLSELKAHSACRKQAIETNGEWFKLSIEQAKKIIENIDES